MTRLDVNPRLRRAVLERREQDWSPEQIAASLRAGFAIHPAMRLPHEAIYRTAYLGHRKSLESGASRHLRTGRTIRQPRSERPPQGQGRLRNMVFIHDRPAAIKERLEPRSACSRGTGKVTG